MTFSAADLHQTETPFWFCLKARPKHEHLAAAGLRQLLQIESFGPRVRFRKSTRRGAVWFTEAMFPGYLFARFIFATFHRQVEYAPGIRGLVRFGERVAALPDNAIETMREASGEQEVVTFDPELRIGDSVQIAEGAFQGLQAVVTQLLPAKERVKVLLEFLGRSVEAEISVPKVLSTQSPRLGISGKNK
jgi:transcriptional antiterminator RfaH